MKRSRALSRKPFCILFFALLLGAAAFFLCSAPTVLAEDDITKITIKTGNIGAEGDGLGKEPDGVFKPKGAVGGEQLPAGADIQRDELLLLPAAFGGRLPGDGDRGGDDAGELLLRKAKRVGAEGVGDDEVAPRVIIGALNRQNGIRMRKVPPLGRFAGPEPAGLQQAAHAAVQRDDAAL